MLLFLLSMPLQLQAGCDLTGSNGYCNQVLTIDEEGNVTYIEFKCEEENGVNPDPDNPPPPPVRCAMIILD